MTKEQRKELRAKIIETIDEITADETNRDSKVTLGAHAVERRLMYAGGSQWIGCGRDWYSIESGWGWVVDKSYHLTTPDLFGFDGHNMIERQTGYYLMPGYDEHAEPHHEADATILTRVPNTILIALGRALVDAKRAAEEKAKESEQAASEILAAL